MANNPNILSIKEPVVDSRGFMTRTWYRFMDSLLNQSGSTASPLIVPQNTILNAGDFTSGGTITIAEQPPRTLLGNSGTVAAEPTAQVVDASLSFESGTLAAVSIPAGTLLGNSGTASAAAGAIALGTNLSLSGNTLNASTSAPDDQTVSFSIQDARAPVAALNARLAAVESLLWSVEDGRAGLCSFSARLTAVESLLWSIRDQRAQIAALQRQLNDTTTLSLLTTRSPP